MTNQALTTLYGSDSLKESYHLLSYVLDEEKSYVLTHQDQFVSKEQILKLEKMIEKRNQHYPLAYLTEKVDFMAYEFHVEEGVLIPRADSEIMIEQLLTLEPKKQILDLCCGSGVLGITYALYFHESNVILSDISEKCIEVSEMNIDKHHLNDRVRTLKSDLFSAVPEVKFDLIMSNPPYIRTDEINTLMESVRDHEPLLALDGGSDGLSFYREIIKKAKSHLNEKGILALEIGINQKEDVFALLMQQGYKDILSFKDYNKIDRIIIAYY
ncbi:MAG: peptide chain release factor N(5)-glutamine methyltransferase [Clostridia bacterium]|nr:peptide chain release factor N(5)-glutamine methyltransferase [Clostridia bacterium]